MTNKQIGELNGQWSVLFRLMLGLNALALPLIVTWAVWVSNSLISIEYEMKLKTMDRLTGSMFVEIQDKLQTKNPNMKWLDAAEVREIQKNNAPY